MYGQVKNGEIDRSRFCRFLTRPIAGSSWSVSSVVSNETAHIRVDFSTQSASRELADLLFDVWEHVFGQLWLAATTPTTKLMQLDRLPLSHLKLIREWNARAVRAAQRLTIDLILDHVEAQPDDPAICSWDRNMSYRELDDASTKLAHHLIGLGLYPSSYVALCFEKSALTIVSMLAVLKTGAAFVHVDPGHPVDRLRTILRSAEARMAIVQPKHAHLFQSFSGRVIIMDIPLTERLTNTVKIAPPVFPCLRPSFAAYMVFTSGSTGMPKGIVVEHEALATAVDCLAKPMGISKQSRMLQFAAYTFDVSIGEIFVTLSQGACLCIPSEEERLNDLARAVAKMQANVACLTPSVARLFSPSDLPTLTHLSVGGEALTYEIVKTWAGRVCLSNVYGPSEATIWCMANENLSPDTPSDSIGRGLQVRTWITEHNDPSRLCPIGCVGELLLEGPMLARGYLEEEQTNAAFVEFDLLGDETSGLARRYRTGDLVRYNADGSHTFVGRKDSQVKVHGHRIEPGELEHHILSCDIVEQAIVLLPAIGSRAGRLSAVACFKRLGRTTSAGSTSMEKVGGVDIEEAIATVQNDLRTKMPSYMMPLDWVAVASMPLLPSGKLNRKLIQRFIEELPSTEVDIALSCGQGGIDREETRSADETLLGALWAAALGVSQHRLHFTQSFMRCGGDSLSAIAFVRACRAQGLSVSVQDVLAGKTIQQLATRERRQAISPSRDVIVIDEAQAQYLEHLRPKLPSAGLSTTEITLIYPCTAVQQDFILVETRNGPAHRSQLLFEIAPRTASSSIDVLRLRSAWQRMVARHALLRTVFIEAASTAHDTSFYQVVLKVHEAEVCIEQFTVPLNEGSLDGNPPIQFPANRPPHRLRIFRCQNGTVTCCLELSHAIYDGVTYELLLDELMRAYDGYDLGDTSSTDAFQTFCMTKPSSVAGSDLSYWEGLLKDVSPCFFPARLEHEELARPQITQPRNSSITVSTSLFRDFCTQHNVSPAPFFHAAWSLVLKSFAGQDDVCFGYATAGRDAPIQGIEHALGVFINTQVCRVNVANGQTVGKLLQTLQMDMATGLDHQHASLAEIQHSFDGQTLFNSLVSFQKIDDDLDPSCSITIKKCASVEPSVFDVNILIFAHPVETHIELHYAPSFISPQHAPDILRTFEQAMRAIIDNSTAAISALNLVSARDQERITLWNGEKPVAVPGLFNTIFERIAEESPELQAVDAWDGSYTYAELNNSSSQLAAVLQARGVHTGVPVPYCFEKSRYAILAVLAILKAGGVCVAFDPAAPRTRLQELVAITKSSVMIASIDASTSCSGLGPAVLPVGSDFLQEPHLGGTTLSGNAKLGISTNISPSDPAFILFTSGSTGKPKAIEVPHSSICSQAYTYGDILGVSTGSRVLQFAAHTFDVSMIDTVTALANGACLCIPSDTDRMNRLSGFINEYKITAACLTPTVANLLKPSEVPTLEVLSVAGEPVTQQLLDTWADAVTLHECYGPAEVSISNRAPSIRRQDNPSNVGHGVRSWLFIVDPDDYNRLLPVGAIGELLVEGPFLARGYWEDPERTKISFVKNPVWTDGSDTSPRMLYRTGDMVQYSADGSLIIHGRRDSQIKVNGRRVEAAEIEAFLIRASPAFVETAIELVSMAGRGGKKRLTAFCSLKEPAGSSSTVFSGSRVCSLAEANIDTISLNRKLVDSLPAYMSPSLFIAVSPLPKTRSGKVDRKALRVWAGELSEEELIHFSQSKSDKQKPTGQAELFVQQLWADVLGIDKHGIGRDDHFFRVGGDSALSMQLVSLSRRRDYNLSVADVFKHPTLSDLANIIRPLKDTKTSETIQIKPFQLLGGRDKARQAVATDLAQFDLPWEVVEDIYPCTPLQSGLMALSTKHPGCYTFQTIYTMPADLDLERFMSAWDATVDACEALRLRIVLTESHGACQVVLDTGVEWSEHDDLNTYLLADSKAHMEYGDCLNRFAIAHEDDKSYFVWTAHHTVYDGMSLPLILAKVEQEYETGTSSPVLSIAPLLQEITMTDRQDLASFWTVNLSGFSSNAFPLLPASTYEPRTNNRLVQDILIQRHSSTTITLASLLRAAWSLVLSQLSGSNDFVLGITTSGRNSPVPGITKMIGPAIATVPVRFRYNDLELVRDYLERVQADAAAMIPYEQAGLPFIRSLGSDQQQACEFRNLFVVQPKAISDQQSYAAADGFLGLQRLPINERGFHPYPLVLECYLEHSGRVSLNLEYDDHVITSSLASSLVKQLAYVTTTLDNSANTPGTTINTFSEASTNRESSNPRPADAGVNSHDSRSANGHPHGYMNGQTNEDGYSTYGISSNGAVKYTCPATPLQEAMLASQARSPSFYSHRLVWTLRPSSAKQMQANLAERVRDSWRQLVAANDVLRTVFRNKQDGMQQSQHEQIILQQTIPNDELLQCTTKEEAIQRVQYCHYEPNQKDLPLHRLLICGTHDGEVICGLNISHALMDGVTLTHLLHKLGSSISDGTIDDTTQRQFRDLARWMAVQPDHDEAQAYWANYLSEAAMSCFPASNVIQSELSHIDFLRSSTVIDREQDLAQLCHKYGITLSTVFRTVWALALSQYLSQADVTFAYVVSGRDAPIVGATDIFGPFLNFLPCRAHLDRYPRIGDLFRHIQADFWESMPHQFGCTAELERIRSGRVKYNTLVNFRYNMARHSAADTTSGQGVDILWSQDPMDYDLVFAINDRKGALELELSYWHGGISDGTATDILQTVVSLLSRVLDGQENVAELTQPT
ncbi:hypothetical protein AMS68_003246 [Peltaster fructicola]|uniref:Carrier domain-containing protein n=1 Tax=Peltaster fructicola TaxID=286661 RepID=A0A6H0XSY2_9PEZI|nr:hypothetical protein AMS68_003246 [Peltaster fructicola]